MASKSLDDKSTPSEGSAVGLPPIWSTQPFLRSLVQAFGYGLDWPDVRLQEIEYEKIDAYPNGYPRLAAYINSDHNFLVYRKFGTARNRVLLHRQQQVVAAERALYELDCSNEKHGFARRLQTIYQDKVSVESEKDFKKRNWLIEDLSDKLAEYDKLLLREAQIEQFDSPSRRNYLSLYHWIWNLKPVVREEGKFFSRADDFVILSRRAQDSPLRVFIEGIILSLPRSWTRLVFTNKHQKQATSEASVTLADRGRVDSLIRVIIVATTVFMVVIPHSILLEGSIYGQIGTPTILTFTAGFAMVVSVFARPSNLALITGTACLAITSPMSHG
ncbi:hypothetical protein EJ05DRAFT_485807 [Pseudovirgaria hyperparasitica]|uniref:DUF6594 domain-containing protein n=1 Tax=Pseudovirgaria hyperparasitica TaxID=470096 RepID=A0A6A6W781_9PEZI|nr:uncharacterized protein EJ05DRAFT_485807 [Pseudovirgaria hyperparasitica]KAF2758712.1 hypothetical protein EJ05DRAFT_485807 [Pseudovirgaria hyperparasitica]